MSQNTNIEVIIPVYNCENYIRTCVESIKNQTLKPEIHLMDDGSTDAIKPILEKYKADGITVSFNQKNKGNLQTINRLLSQSNSDYIAFQDADDWSHPNRLHLQIDFIKKNNLDFCFTNFIKTENTGTEIYCGYYPEELFTKNNVEKMEPSICFASILFKKDVYKKIGGFNAYFDQIGGADIDWFYNAVAAGFKGGILKTPLYFYRNNEVSYTSTVSLDARKQISVEIARYFYQYRTKNNCNLPLSKLNHFITRQLNTLKFDHKKNIRNYIVQSVSNKKYLKTFQGLIKYLTTRPFNLADLKIIKYIAYKVINDN